MEDSSQYNKASKRKSGIKFEKDEVKLSFFSDGIMVYVGNAKEPQIPGITKCL